MIEAHVRETGSEKGRRLLENFAESAGKFKKIIPRDYRKMLERHRPVRRAGHDPGRSGAGSVPRNDGGQVSEDGKERWIFAL